MKRIFACSLAIITVFCFTSCSFLCSRTKKNLEPSEIIKTEIPASASVTEEMSICLRNMGFDGNVSDQGFCTIASNLSAGGISLYGMGKFYDLFGKNSVEYAYGTMENTASFRIGYKCGKLNKRYGLDLSPSVLGIEFPKNIKFGNTLKDTLSAMGVTEQFGEPNEDEFDKSLYEDEHGSLRLQFLAFHMRYVDTSLENAYCTLRFEHKWENKENETTHNYLSQFDLIYKNGILENCAVFYSLEYDDAGFILPKPKKLGFFFSNGYDISKEWYNAKIHSVTYDRNSVKIVFSASSDKPEEITASISFWYSYDHGSKNELKTFAVNKKKKYSFSAKSGDMDLLKDYAFVQTSWFDFNLHDGEAWIYRGESR